MFLQNYEKIVVIEELVLALRNIKAFKHLPSAKGFDFFLLVVQTSPTYNIFSQNMIKDEKFTFLPKHALIIVILIPKTQVEQITP